MKEKGRGAKETGSIEWFYRWSGFLAIVWFGSTSTPFPYISCASCLCFSVFLCVAGRAYWRERGAWSQIKLLKKSFNTLFKETSLCSSHLAYIVCGLSIVLPWAHEGSLLHCHTDTELPPQHPPLSTLIPSADIQAEQEYDNWPCLVTILNMFFYRPGTFAQQIQWVCGRILPLWGKTFHVIKFLYFFI